MATKHMNAAPGDFAETVLMPGDPLRAQYITDTYLEDARRVSDVRNMWGFTGTYKGSVNPRMIDGVYDGRAAIVNHPQDSGVQVGVREATGFIKFPVFELADQLDRRALFRVSVAGRAGCQQ